MNAAFLWIRRPSVLVLHSLLTWSVGREERRDAIPLLAATLVALAVLPTPAIAAPPIGMADIRFRPGSVAAAVGGLFSVEVVVAAAAEVEGVQVVIAYDPAHLEVVSAEPTGPLIHHLRTENDAAAGRLFYAAGALGGRFPSGSFPLLRLAFRLKAAPTVPLTVLILPESRQRTIVAAAATNALHESRPLAVTVDPTQCRVFPVEGTASLFERFYTVHDSLRLLGRPLGSAGVWNGTPFQLFEKGRLEDHSANAALPPERRFQYGLLVTNGASFRRS